MNKRIRNPIKKPQKFGNNYVKSKYRLINN
jgi:hypothetical protein